MNMRATRLLGGALVALVVLSPACAQEVPDALTVEWKGKKPCEKLFEDDKIRVLRCTFGPTKAHVRHGHPPKLAYTLSGGKVRVEDARGLREAEPKTGNF